VGRVQNALKDPNVLLGVGGALLAVAVSPHRLPRRLSRRLEATLSESGRVRCARRALLMGAAERALCGWGLDGTQSII